MKWRMIHFTIEMDKRIAEREAYRSSCERRGKHRRSNGSSGCGNCDGHISRRECDSCSSSFQNSPFPLSAILKHKPKSAIDINDTKHRWQRERVEDHHCSGCELHNHLRSDGTRSPKTVYKPRVFHLRVLKIDLEAH